MKNEKQAADLTGVGPEVPFTLAPLHPGWPPPAGATETRPVREWQDRFSLLVLGANRPVGAVIKFLRADGVPGTLVATVVRRGVLWRYRPAYCYACDEVATGAADRTHSPEQAHVPACNRHRTDGGCR